ncbi:MAG: hypothetical protein IPJ41_09890 [Phycisphaerales bacterium]|nr:hypothetical protein [Phycisphaerales bacterium]
MTQVRIQSETEVPQGWRYVVEVSRESGRRVLRMRLAWVDHNFWAGDRAVPPSRVAQAVVEYLLESRPDDELPDRFDAAMARRWSPEIDRELALRL